MVTNIFLGLIIALLPLVIKINGQFDTSRESKDWLFLYLSLITISLISSSGRSVNKLIKWSAAYLLIMAVVNQHAFFARHVPTHTIGILVGVCLFIRFYESFDRKSIQYIFDGMICGSVIQGIFTISSYFGFELYATLLKLSQYEVGIYYSVAKERYALDFIAPLIDIVTPKSGVSNAVGSLGNSNLVAGYLCMTIPSFMGRRKLIPFAIIPLLALALTQSYMGIISFIASMGYLINYRYNIVSKTKIYLCVIAIMLAAPLFHLGVDSGRFGPWRRVLSQASIKHWLIGMGPGWFADQNMLMDDGITKFVQEHNSFLSFFNIYGLAGFLVLAPMFYTFLKTKDKNPMAAVTLFAIFCNSYGHFTLHQSTLVIIIIPVLAICLREE